MHGFSSADMACYVEQIPQAAISFSLVIHLALAGRFQEAGGGAGAQVVAIECLVSVFLTVGGDDGLLRLQVVGEL